MFVEDKLEEIDSVLTLLKTTKYFEVNHVVQYSLVHESRIPDTDLFVLDVLDAAHENRAFRQFIATLRMYEKPFIAFTCMYESGRLSDDPNDTIHPRLIQEIFEHGGLGMVPKHPGAGVEAQVLRGDLKMRLVERIMDFYWAWALANRT